MGDVGDVEFWMRQTAGLVFCCRSIKKTGDEAQLLNISLLK
jgi:hypothetical protein